MVRLMRYVLEFYDDKLPRAGWTRWNEQAFTRMSEAVAARNHAQRVADDYKAKLTFRIKNI